MKPWINEDIFKSWTEAQKRLWDSLCSAVPFRPPAGLEAWRETYLKNLAAWETAVRQTLAQEATWVRRWVDQAAREKGEPDMMAAWVRQMEDVLQRWVQTQGQWWDEYFAVLRRGGAAGFERAGAVPSSLGAKPAPTTPAANGVGIEPAPPVAAEPAPPAGPPAEPPAASSAETPAEPAVAPAAAPVPPQPDDLKSIVGIGPALEKKLHDQGIVSYRQLAALDEAGIDRLEAAIKTAGRGRVRRDDWIGQAKAQHFQKYRERL